MGLVISPAFPSSIEAVELKTKKSKKAEPVVETIAVEECCALGCDDCFLPEEIVNE